MAGQGRVNIEVGFSVDKAGLTQMQSLFQQIANSAKEPGNNLNAGLQKAATTANTLDQILEKTFNTELGTLNVTKFNQELSKSGLTLKTVKNDLTAIGNQGATAYNRLAQAVLGTNLQLKQTSKTLDQMAITFKNTIRYGISSSIFNNLTNAIQRAYTYSKQLDTSLNDIRIVTDKSAENMDKFAENANQAAKSMGASTLDYTNAALIYYQQGLSDEEVAARAETTIKAANVTGQTGEEVSEQLTAVWNGYKVTAEETELYVDKLAAVAATTAADLEELSKGMSKVAAAANAMGVDFDDLNAQIATIVSVTRQAPESVGTALKTIYARLGDLKVDGVDEFGVSLGEVSGQLETMGIQILDQNGDLRAMSDVIAEVAEKWGTWTRAQQQAAAVAMAGKRQYNNLVALFENWDMYSDALETSANSLGTLQHQQDIYMESTAAKLKTLKATWQDLYKGIIDEDELNAGIEGLTNLVQVIDNFFDSFGGGLKSITAFGTIIASIFNKQIADSIANATQRVAIFKNNLELTKTANIIRQQGAEEAGNTIQSQAIAANTKAQIEYSQRIYDARLGLNQEQANTLIGYQKEIGALEEEIVLETKRAEKLAESLGIETAIAEKILSGVSAENAFGEKLQENVAKEDHLLQIAEELKQNLSNIKIFGNVADDFESVAEEATKIYDIISKYPSIWEKLSSEEQKVLQESQQEENVSIAYEGTIKNIKNILEKTIPLYEKAAQETTVEYDNALLLEQAYQKIAEKKINQNNIKQQADEMLRLAENATNVSAVVTSITSSLGNLAMAWSSVNALFDAWTDKEASFGDKITQTFMTLGMTIPIVITNFTKLNEVMVAFGALQVRRNALNILEIAGTAALSQITDKETAIKVLNNIAQLNGLKLTEKDIEEKAIQILATRGLTKEVEKLTLAQKAWQVVANTPVAIVAVLTAIVAAIAIAKKAYDAYIQNLIDLNDAEIERVNKIQEEIDANKELYDEYNKLYKQYQNNEVEKEALYDVTDKLCDKYNIEGSYLAKLTGDYDSLTKSIKKAREEELKTGLSETQKQKESAGANLLNIARQGTGHLEGSRYIATLAANNAHSSNTQANDILSKYGFTSGIIDIDANDSQQLINTYDQLQKAQEEMLRTMGPSQIAISQTYATVTSWLEKMAPAVETYKNALDELDNYNVQLIANQIDFASATSLDDFQNKIVQFKKALSSADLNTTDSIDDIVSKYIEALDSTYGNIILGIDELKKQVDDEADAYIDSLTEGQKEYLLSGKVDLKFVQTKEDIEAELQKSFNNYGTFDVTSPVSLASTLASGTKLKKADNQAIASLESDNPEAMAGFDDKSVLHQLEVIDEITQYRIQKNHEFLQDTDTVIQKEIDLRDQERESLFKTKEAYIEATEELKKNSNLSREEQAELQNRINKYEELGYVINDLQNDLNHGLSFDEIEDIGFESLISSIDMVTNKAEALKTAAELIGEGFTVAASDVEKLSNVFPELLENYQALSDGSVQLDQEVVKKNIEGIQAEMQARTDAKILEVDQQIALKELEQEYLQEKLKNLEAYLQGKQTEQATIDAINKAGFDYESGLMELTGQEITELTNHAIASSNSEGGTLISMLNQVGRGFAQAAKAHYAMLNGQDFDWQDLDFSGTAASAQQYASSFGEQATALYEKNSAMYEQIYEEAQQVQEQLNTVSGELDKLQAQKAVLESTSKSASHALDNVASGKAGKDSKSKSGGSKKKDKEDKKLEDEFDRYWDIKKAIDAVDRAVSKLDKDQENLYGYELINSLHKENELLEQQEANYRALADAQRQEAAELQGVLAGYGVAFDASGAITNYAAATAAALQEYNDAIHQYNMGLIDESTLGVYEKNYEKFKKALERYDTLFYQEMKDTEEKLDDLRRKKLANNLKAWQVEIQLKLDMKDLERQWNDFITKVQKDFQKVYGDLRVDLKNMLDDARTYTGDEGTIATIINGVHDVTNEIDKMRFGGESDMFESISQAQEELKDLNQKLLDAGEALHDLWEQAWDNYLDGIDQVADQFDDLIDRFERINDELEFQGKLIELLYGEEAYNLMNKLYQGQEHNMEAQINSLKQQKDMWEQLFYASGATLDNQTEWTEDQQKYYKEWMDAQSDLNNLVLDYIELLKTDYINTVKDVLKQFETFVSGSSLAHLGDQWDRIADRAEKYYDSVEGAYEVQNLANKMDESIAKEDSLKVQQKLQALRDKEIKYLREKENLTEYDLQAAEARFQIALKEAALEDARNNKTSMKLTRNEQGNWSYQYIADEEEVMSKRQELLDTYNQLYQLASDAYEANLEALQNLQQTYLDKALEIYESEVLSEEEKQQQLLELREWYLEEYKLLAEENTLYRNDLEEGAAALLLEIYEQDQSAYTAMTEAERALLDELIAAHVDGFLDLEEKLKENYNNIGDKAAAVMADTRADWTSGAQTIADIWNGDNGFSVKVQVLNAYDTINQASLRYKDLVDWCAAAVARDFSEEGIAGAIMRAEQETDNLSGKTVDLVNTSISYLSQLRAYVDQIADAWKSVQQAIMDAIGLIQEYLRYIGAANAAAAQGISGNAVQGTERAANKNTSGSPIGTRTSTADSGTRSFSGSYMGNTNEMYNALNGLTNAGQQSAVELEWRQANKYALNQGRTYGYATGGYTGEWNNGSTDGRLAFLHQKELVLNENDTANFLKGITTLREMTGLNGSIESAILKSVAGMALSLGTIKSGSIHGGSTTNETSNVFNIQAEFPNANNVDEIREAILTLPNIASQRANLNLK